MIIPFDKFLFSEYIQRFSELLNNNNGSFSTKIKHQSTTLIPFFCYIEFVNTGFRQIEFENCKTVRLKSAISDKSRLLVSFGSRASVKPCTIFHDGRSLPVGVVSRSASAPFALKLFALRLGVDM